MSNEPISRTYCGGNITEFIYKNHEYIQFGTCNSQSIVHNPDCKECNKNKN